MNVSRGRHRGREGSVLVMSLMAVMVVSILAAGFLQLSLSVTQRQRRSVDNKLAFYLAEAGLAEAYAGLAIAKTGNVGTPAQPAAFGDGLFWVEATPDPGGLVDLECTAMVGAGRVTLGMAVEPVEIPVSRLGLFISDAFYLNPETYVDSYDSRLGDYVSQVDQPSNFQAPVASNGDITLSSSAQVRGDVTAGPAGTILLQSGASVTGSTGQGEALYALPPIEVPTLPVRASISHSSVVPLVIPPGAAATDSIYVNRDSTLIIQGPSTLVVDDLYLETGGEIQLDTTLGPVDWYVTGNIALKAGSLLTTASQETGNVSFQVASPSTKSVNFGSSSKFYGFIYAPSADVKMGSSFEVFGGMVAKSLNLAAKGRFHFDVGRATSGAADILPKLHAWRVVDIPQNLATNRTDPFGLLGVDREALPGPADAHQDQWLVLEYVDRSGATVTYEGWESAFDWTDVQKVVTGSRDDKSFLEPIKEPPPEDPATTTLVYTEAELISMLWDNQQNASTLVPALLDSSPLTDPVLIEALNRNRTFSSSDYRQILQESSTPVTGSPLSPDILMGAINKNREITSSDLKVVLIENSPLPTTVLQAAINRPLDPSDLDAVLAAQ